MKSRPPHWLSFLKKDATILCFLTVLLGTSLPAHAVDICDEALAPPDVNDTTRMDIADISLAGPNQPKFYDNLHHLPRDRALEILQSLLDDGNTTLRPDLLVRYLARLQGGQRNAELIPGLELILAAFVDKFADYQGPNWPYLYNIIPLARTELLARPITIKNNWDAWQKVLEFAANDNNMTLQTAVVLLEIIQKVDLPVALAKKITDRIEYNANYFITGTPALEPQVVTDHSNNEIFVRSQFLEDQTTGRLRFRYRAPRNVASPAIDPIVLERIFRVALGVPHPNLALRARWAHSQAPKRTQQPAIFPIRGDLSKMVIFQNGRWLTFRRVQEGSGQEIYYECVANESTPPPELIRLTEQSETTELGARRYTPDELLRLIYDQRQRQDGELVPTNYSGTITDQQDLRETEPSPQQHSSIVLEGLERSWADLTFHELGVPTTKNKETPNWERHFNHHFNNGVYEIDERRQVKIKGAHTLEAFQKVIRKINDRLASDDLRVTGVQPGQPVTFRLSADSDSPIFYSYQITYRAGRGPTRVKSILSPVPLDHVAHHVETAVHEEFQDLAASVPPALRAAFNGAVHKFYYLAWREALSAAWRNPTPTSYSFTVPALDGFNNPIDLEMKASPNEYLKETLAAQARLTLSQRRGQLPPNLSTVELFGFDTIYPAPVAP